MTTIVGHHDAPWQSSNSWAVAESEALALAGTVIGRDSAAASASTHAKLLIDLLKRGIAHFRWSVGQPAEDQAEKGTEHGYVKKGSASAELIRLSALLHRETSRAADVVGSSTTAHWRIGNSPNGVAVPQRAYIFAQATFHSSPL